MPRQVALPMPAGLEPEASPTVQACADMKSPLNSVPSTAADSAPELSTSAA